MTQQLTFRGEGGAVMYLDRAALPEGIARRLERGDLVPCDPDGAAVPVAEDAVPDVPPPDAPALPKRAESRAVWVKFAIGQGMDAAQANLLTKAQLIEEFTKDRG